MRRLLVVTYYAPPLGLSGVMRVTKLCKFLPEFGWRPLLLTVKPVAYRGYDENLLQDLREARVFRTESFDPNRLYHLLRSRGRRQHPVLRNGVDHLARLLNSIAFPDAKIGWFPFASVAGRHIIDREKPAAVFATAPPFTSLLLGVRLKAHGHIPLVLDFRDPWPSGFRPPPRWQRSALRDLRRRLMEKADLVLAVNEGTAKAIGGAVVLPNGFDPDDFQSNVEPLPGLSIVHVGNVFGDSGQILSFVRALEQVPQARLYMVGGVDVKTRQQLRNNKQVVMLGVLPHGQACAMCKAGSVLLYVGKTGQPVGLKLYEYLGAGRPILVWGDGNEEAVAIVRSVGAGVDCGTNEGLVREFLTGRSLAEVDYSQHTSPFNRRLQARWLAERLESLVVAS
ncbi:MAG: glycosyltransferase [candidate division WOR-3 bacterium]